DTRVLADPLWWLVSGHYQTWRRCPGAEAIGPRGPEDRGSESSSKSLTRSARRTPVRAAQWRRGDGLAEWQAGPCRGRKVDPRRGWRDRTGLPPAVEGRPGGRPLAALTRGSTRQGSEPKGKSLFADSFFLDIHRRPTDNHRQSPLSSFSWDACGTAAP